VFKDDDELNRRLALAVTNSYSNSGTSISSSSSASDALFELHENDNDDGNDELDRRLALAVATADAHENASLASRVPGAWPADFAADDADLDISDEEDDDEEEIDDEEEADQEEEADDDADDADDITRRLALAEANGNALAAAAHKRHEEEKASIAKKRARADAVEEEENGGSPNAAKKAKLDSSWLPEWAFVDKPTVPIHPGTNAAERMWWERYAARKGMHYHHDVFMCGQRPGDVL
jgi:hypothetical protein